MVTAENPIIVHIPANKIKLKARRDGIAHDEWHVFELFNLTFNKPVYTEQDSVTHLTLPKETRLRGLTSQATSYVHVQYRTFVVKEGIKLPESMNPATLKMTDLAQKVYFQCVNLIQCPNVPFMNVPVLDRSILCHSSDKGRDMQEMGECIMDPGGTFVVNGGERLLMYRERPPFNTAFCQMTTKSPSDSHQIEYRADYPGNFKSTATLYIPLTRETRVMPPVLHATISRIKKSKAATATATSAAIQVISIFTWIRALGVLTCGQDIYNMFKLVAGDRWNSNKFYQTILVDTLAQSNRHLADMTHEIMTSPRADFFEGEMIPRGKLPADSSKYWQKLALMCVGRSSKIMEKNPTTLISLGQFILEQKFLPNMSACYSDGNYTPEQSACVKTMSLIQMSCQLIDFLVDKKMAMNKDSYLTKRFDSVDDLISSLFRQLLLIYLKNLRERIKKTLCSGKIFNVYDLFGSDNRIGKGLCDAIASGAWHATRDNISQTGISQRCTRQNYCDIATLYMVVVNSMVRRSKQAGPRQLDPSSFGILDPNDTPEGETCGLRKYLALMLLMSLGASEFPILKMLARYLAKIEYQGQADWTFVHNKDAEALIQIAQDKNIKWVHKISIVANGTGTFMIFTKNSKFDALSLARTIVGTIRSWRQSLQIGIDTSVCIYRKSPQEKDYMEIRICTDRARPSRPVLNCKNLHVMQKLDHQVRKGQPIVWMDLIRDGLVEYMDKCEEADFDICIATDLYQALNSKASTKDKTGMEYTHVEIHGLAVVGISSGLIPFTQFNQGPRNTYGSAMSRQAMASSSTSNSKHRMDLSGVQFWYPQVPLAKTVLSTVLGFDILPNGQNHETMILTTGKEAQEDAQIDDLTCHDRGFSRCSIFRTVTVSASAITLGKDIKSELDILSAKPKLTTAEKAKLAKLIVPGQETFKKMSPEQTLRPKLADYSQIEDADGLICAGKMVDADTVIAQRVSKIPPVMIPGGTIDAHGIDAPVRYITEKDNAEIVKSFSSATISKVAICNDNKGDIVAKIGIAQNRRMERGDKQANRHGQKGTLGRLASQEDMPFDEYGGSPVTILSSLAFPSRMLWADLIEKLINLIASAKGVRADSTPFSNGYRALVAKVLDSKMSKDGQPYNETEQEFLKRYSNAGYTKELSDETEMEIQERISSILYRALAAMGMHPSGERTMYSGETGTKLHGRMFSSSSYKLILRHIAGWKLRSRQEGERDRLTQQPVSGKNRNGGLKVNVMERDALLASGATEVIQNLLVVCSDPDFMVVCQECNCNCIYGNQSHRTYCKVCDKYDTGLKIPTSAGTVLTQQEMGAVGINLQMMVVPA